MPRAHDIELRAGAVTFRVLTAGTGAPLVYFHSFYERGGWSPLLDHLAARFTVYAPLHPGVAGSTGVEALDDVLDLTLVYDELLSALGVARAHLLGHFFGAMVAAEIAAVFPARAERLVLASPLGLWRDDAPQADIVTLPADDAANMAAQIESIQRRAAMAKFVWPIPDKGLRKRLHRIAAPTLILWGEADRTNPVVYGEEWQRRIKGAALKLLPGGHMMLHESPESAATTIAEFLL